MRSTSAFKRTEIPESIYILIERDKIIVHWLLCMIFFALSNHAITLYFGSVDTFFLPSFDTARFAQVYTKVAN